MALATYEVLFSLPYTDSNSLDYGWCARLYFSTMDSSDNSEWDHV